MRVNLRRSRQKPEGVSTAIALLVLAGELGVFFYAFSVQERFLRIIPSPGIWVVTRLLVYLGAAIWGLRIWPRFSKPADWVVWTVSFGAAGAALLYLGMVLKYGSRAGFVYGACFLSQAMIGIAGLAKVSWSKFANRNGGAGYL